MSIDARPARAAEQSNPGSNVQFDRGWGFQVATGPDVPDQPAHSYVWHPSVTERRLLAVQRARPAWRKAEADFNLVSRDRA